ncbi:hypothetical protein ACSHWG_00950 [Leucobacter sp. Z1108]
MATLLGARLLARYAEGTATVEQLQAALARGWISQDEYDTATTDPTG